MGQYAKAIALHQERTAIAEEVGDWAGVRRGGCTGGHTGFMLGTWKFRNGIGSK